MDTNDLTNSQVNTLKLALSHYSEYVRNTIDKLHSCDDRDFDVIQQWHEILTNLDRIDKLWE